MSSCEITLDRIRVFANTSYISSRSQDAHFCSHRWYLDWFLIPGLPSCIHPRKASISCWEKCPSYPGYFLGAEGEKRQMERAAMVRAAGSSAVGPLRLSGLKKPVGLPRFTAVTALTGPVWFRSGPVRYSPNSNLKFEKKKLLKKFLKIVHDL
jgi:hypothetical protein